MTMQDDALLHAKVFSRLEDWCSHLGWEFHRAGETIAIGVAEAFLRVSPEKVRGIHSLRLVLPLSSGLKFNTFSVLELYRFFLLRNSQLAYVHWCIEEWQGHQAVMAIRDLNAMTKESFRDAVTQLRCERQDILELLEHDARVVQEQAEAILSDPLIEPAAKNEG